MTRTTRASSVAAPSVVVVGGANMDVKAHSTNRIVSATSNPGSTSMTPGGVGRNIAENLARLGTTVHLVAAVGVDALGELLVTATRDAGVGVEHVRRGAPATGTYTAVLDADGELLVAVSDMSATDELLPERVRAAADLLADAHLVVIDGNVPPQAFAVAVELATDAGVPVIVEPVSVPKATSLMSALQAGSDLRCWCITPNLDELAALAAMPTDGVAATMEAVWALHMRGVEVVWVRLGAEGSLLSSPEGVARLPALPARVVDVTGAGDAMLAAFCHAVIGGASTRAAAEYAHAAAALTVSSAHTVRPDLTDSLVRSLLP